MGVGLPWSCGVGIAVYTSHLHTRPWGTNARLSTRAWKANGDKHMERGILLTIGRRETWNKWRQKLKMIEDWIEQRCEGLLRKGQA